MKILENSAGILRRLSKRHEANGVLDLRCSARLSFPAKVSNTLLRHITPLHTIRSIAQNYSLTCKSPRVRCFEVKMG